MRETRMKDYLPALMEQFPGVPKETIEKIIKHGCQNITHNLVKGFNIDLRSKIQHIRMLIYKPSKPKVKKDVPDSAKQL